MDSDAKPWHNNSWLIRLGMLCGAKAAEERYERDLDLIDQGVKLATSRGL